MRYLVKLGELRQKIDFMEQQLAIIDENIEKLKVIKTNIVWEGKASNSFDKYYNSYLQELTYIEDRLLLYIKFFIKYYENYGTSYRGLRRKYVNISNKGV